MTTAYTLPRCRSLPDDAPASAFAPQPVAPYRRGFEDCYYDQCWFCPYPPGSADAREYAVGHEVAAKMRRRQVNP